MAEPPPLAEPANATMAALAQRQGRYRLFFLLTTIAFLTVPVSALITGRQTPLHLGLGFAAIVLIVGALAPVLLGRRPYLGRTGRLPILIVASITVIAANLVATTGQTNWISLFYFAAVAGSRIQPDRRAIVLLTVVGVVTAVALAIGGVDIGSAAIQGLSASLIGFAVFSIGTLQRANAQLLAARDEIGRLAVAEERARIARDLHDTLGHSLSVIALKSELAGRLLPASPDRAKAEIA